MPLPPPRKPTANVHSPRPATPSLERLLALVATVSSAAEPDAALWSARKHYAGRMAEQLERAAAQRADYLLNSIERGDGGA